VPLAVKRILIADDHAMLRKGLKETIEEELGEATFGEAANGREVLDQVWKRQWDLVLLDIGMEGRSGLEVLEEIRSARPKLPVLILSMYPEAQFAVRALRLGAVGYINKQSAPEELVVALKKVLAGGRYVSASLAERLATEVQGDAPKAPHEALSNRELQVMRLIASGQSLKEIADELCISVKTVGTYHTRLLDKLNMKSDVEITRYALLNKLVH
jgi:two-component system, NarL family, invasion response regulator UvrY